MKKIKSIEEIINDYDNFIIDQWGVMHDGTFGYKHAINSINRGGRYIKWKGLLRKNQIWCFVSSVIYCFGLFWPKFNQ